VRVLLPESDWAMLRAAYPDSPSWPSVLARIEQLERERDEWRAAFGVEPLSPEVAAEFIQALVEDAEQAEKREQKLRKALEQVKSMVRYIPDRAVMKVIDAALSAGESGGEG
jgi:hypothetical protein